MALDDLTGDLDGYSLRRRLGSGSAGPVWLVRHLTSGRHAVLKRIPGAGIPAPAAFHRSLTTLRTLDHPHLARLLEIRPSGTDWLLFSQYLPAGSLTALLARRGALTHAELVTLVNPVADALATLHEAGLHHGRLTPDNVLFDADGRPVLTDAAQSLQPASTTGDLQALAALTALAAPTDPLPPAVFAEDAATVAREVLALGPPTAINLAFEHASAPPTALTVRRVPLPTGRTVPRAVHPATPPPTGSTPAPAETSATSTHSRLTRVDTEHTAPGSEHQPRPAIPTGKGIQPSTGQALPHRSPSTTPPPASSAPSPADTPTAPDSDSMGRLRAAVPYDWSGRLTMSDGSYPSGNSTRAGAPNDLGVSGDSGDLKGSGDSGSPGGSGGPGGPGGSGHRRRSGRSSSPTRRSAAHHTSPDRTTPRRAHLDSVGRLNRILASGRRRHPSRRPPRRLVVVVALTTVTLLGIGLFVVRVLDAPSTNPAAASTSSPTPDSNLSSSLRSPSPTSSPPLTSPSTPGQTSPSPLPSPSPSSTSASPLPPPSSIPDRAAPPTSWVSVLRTLDQHRAQAFATLDLRQLDAVYAPGSPPWSADRAVLADYRARGVRVTGLRFDVERVIREPASGRTVTLRVTDRLTGGTLLTQDGRGSPMPPGPTTTRRITLSPVGTNWRISAITPT